MALTVEAIVNKALLGIGAKKISDIDASGPVPEAAKLYYDDARREVIRECNWGFARKTVALEACKDVKLADTKPRGVPENGNPANTGIYSWEVYTETFITDTRIKMGAGWRVAEVTVGAATYGYNSSTLALFFGAELSPEGTLPDGTGLVVLIDQGATTTEAGLVFIVGGTTGYPWVAETVTIDTIADVNDIDIKVDISVEGTADLYVEGTKVISGRIPPFGPSTDPVDGGTPSYPPVSDGGYFGSENVGYDSGEQRIFSVKFYSNVAGLPGLPGHFNYSYPVPDDFVKFYEVGADNTPVERHGPRFMSNDDELTLRYLADITDVTKFPPHFEAALVAKLRSDLAIPLGGRNAKKVEWYQLYKEELERALSIEGFEESPNQNTFGVKTDGDSWVTAARYN